MDDYSKLGGIVSFLSEPLERFLRGFARLAQPEARFSDVQELVAGTAGRALLETGDMSKGLFWAGMVQGPIHDTPSCAELIGRIVADAEAIVRDRLGSMLAGSGALVKSD